MLSFSQTSKPEVLDIRSVVVLLKGPVKSSFGITAPITSLFIDWIARKTSCFSFMDTKQLEWRREKDETKSAKYFAQPR
ncbi:hypothetical protein [Pedobacter sp. MC2016-24]|uniref:hypothetical protein n=1 Tax=Pedobacter sp. MC2016-24 TaxID=2780090 RepID=UPI001880EE34|nr:hypothetical protein [Pedobacter sp. MC2016-24]MBE9599883.1 hypothetical protein [Pedobacter sp. MC2016-24]